jgi:CRP-like cAMP-binding protein
MLEQQQTLLEKMNPYGMRVSFPRHNLIYSPDDAAQFFFFVFSGQVSLYLLSRSGRVLTLQIVGPGHPFGHSVLAGSETYDTFAEALTPVQVLELSRQTLLDLIATQPPSTTMLVDALEHYTLAVSRRLDELAFKSVPARLASVLLDMADTSTSDGQPLRIPHRTHQQLAEMINAYRETVTKVIKQFRSDRLLDFDRKGITLLNTSRLRELATRG